MKMMLSKKILTLCHWLPLWGMLIILIACDSQPKESQPDDEYLPDSINTEGMVLEELETLKCFEKENQICESGLFFARIGESIAQVDTEEMEPESVEDSVENQGGYVWMTRTYHFKKGKIVLEGEFLDERQTNDTLLSASTINRLRIESSIFQTKENIRVGSTLSSLSKVYGDSLLQAQVLLNYERIQVQASDSRMIFLIDDPKNELAGKLGETPKISQLPQGAVISAIVVM